MQAYCYVSEIIQASTLYSVSQCVLLHAQLQALWHQVYRS